MIAIQLLIFNPINQVYGSYSEKTDQITNSLDVSNKTLKESCNQTKICSKLTVEESAKYLSDSKIKEEDVEKNIDKNNMESLNIKGNESSSNICVNSELEPEISIKSQKNVANYTINERDEFKNAVSVGIFDDDISKNKTTNFSFCQKSFDKSKKDPLEFSVAQKAHISSQKFKYLPTKARINLNRNEINFTKPSFNSKAPFLRPNINKNEIKCSTDNSNLKNSSFPKVSNNRRSMINISEQKTSSIIPVSTAASNFDKSNFSSIQQITNPLMPVSSAIFHGGLDNASISRKNFDQSALVSSTISNANLRLKNINSIPIESLKYHNQQTISSNLQQEQVLTDLRNRSLNAPPLNNFYTNSKRELKYPHLEKTLQIHNFYLSCPYYKFYQYFIKCFLDTPIPNYFVSPLRKYSDFVTIVAEAEELRIREIHSQSFTNPNSQFYQFYLFFIASSLHDNIRNSLSLLYLNNNVSYIDFLQN